MRRSHGYTMIQHMISCGWAGEGFPGMHNAARSAGCIFRYLEKGRFSDDEVADYLPSLYAHYKQYCKEHGIKPVPYPESLKKREQAIVAKRKRAA